MLIKSSRTFIKDYKPPDYLIDQVIQRRFLYSNTGQTSAGKTALTLYIAAMIAEKQYSSIGGHEIAHGQVLYLAGENTDDIRMRWIAMAHHMEFDLLKIRVHFIDGITSLIKNMKKIDREVRDLGGVVLVVVDTQAAYFEGNNEIDNVEAGNFARGPLRELTTLEGGPCVIVNCHPTKYVKANDNEGLIPRGGGAFVNEMDGNLTVTKDDNCISWFWYKKWRGTELVEPIRFQLERITAPTLVDSKGRQITSAMVKEIDQSQYLKEQENVANDQNKVIKAMLEGATSIRDIADKCGFKLSNGRPYTTKVDRLLKTLKEHKLVKQQRNGSWQITDKGKEEAKMI